MKAVTLVILVLLTNIPIPAASRQGQWQKVQEATAKGQPRTAVEALVPIIQEALQEKAYGEAVRAIAQKVVLEGAVQGNKPEEKIARMEVEISRAPREIAPVLQTIQAMSYWEYFQRNRWRFLQRGRTSEVPGPDFTTWDLPRLFAEIDKKFSQALAGETLKTTPVKEFDDALQQGDFADNYRPTLYDFAAQEALKFYTLGEQAGAQPQDAFEVAADSPIFGESPAFLAWQPQTTDTNSTKFKAIRLYQNLLRFHQKDADKTAYLDVDLARLAWGGNVAAGEEKVDRYRAALKSFTTQWGDHEVAAMALSYLARLTKDQGNWVEARQLALRGKNAHPGSAGGKQCQNLVAEIEARELTIQTERVWNGAQTTIQARYRNLPRIHFRLVAYDWDVFLRKDRSRPESLNDRERKDLLTQAPTLAWSASLPPTADYKIRTFRMPAPANLKPGFYFLLASVDASFSDKDNQVTYTDIWVSDLALVARPREGSVEGFVLEAGDGDPIKGAKVAAWYLDNQRNRVPLLPVTTDENGCFSFPRQNARGLLLRVSYNGQELGSRQEIWSYGVDRQNRERPQDQTVLFTDRALYRPGQTIQYKGICLRLNPAKDNYEVLKREELFVVLSDPNGKEVARQKHGCNDYGSFSGSFTAPRDRLPGQMSLRVISGPAGAASVSVEEYKRPKFQTTLAAPKVGPQLNGQVQLQGKAESYTGAAVDGAAVKWRVVRQVRWPDWWSWRQRAPVSSQQEIAHGTTQTDTDGTYKIQFVARPDLSISPTNEPSFIFTVYSEVTDNTGETRSANRNVQAGYTALRASLQAEEWQTVGQPVELRIKTTTLDGEPQVAEGVVKIYRLQGPEKVQRQSNGAWDDQDDQGLAPDSSNPSQWPLGRVLVEKGFTTDTNGVASLASRLGAGSYRAMVETQDRFGKKVTARLPITVLEPEATRCAVKIPQVFAAPKWQAQPGEKFSCLWGTGYETGRAFVEILHRGKIIERFWTKSGNTQQRVEKMVTEAMRGGFSIHITQVRENRAYLEMKRVDVPWSNKELDIQWEHFTSKLEPGQKETWTAVISKKSGGGVEKVVAEMVATLYDASLDHFQPHYWPSRLGDFRTDYASFRMSFENMPQQFQWMLGQWRSPRVPVPMQYRRFKDELVRNPLLERYAMGGGDGMLMAATPVPTSASPRSMAAKNALPPAPMMLSEAELQGLVLEKAAAAPGNAAMETFGGAAGAVAAPPPKQVNLDQVAARKNLTETAFFYPHLTSDTNGVVRLEFTMPEALTTWRFLGFAHDARLRSGRLEGQAVTAREIMVQPNPPRFLREGDVLEFTVKVANQSAARQTGKVRLTFQNILNERNADQDLANRQPEQTFDIPAKESRGFSWRLSVPDGAGLLLYKTVASCGRFSDGEEGYLPVLSRRIQVTESLPLPIRGPAEKWFQFTELLKSGESSTLRHQNLVVQMVSNPSWYAVLALPYLMEFPYECSEQTFNRWYANSLARHIANSDVRIRRIFDAWKNTPALDSPLEKNQDLKAVVLEETPWLRQAQKESQNRKNVGLLFDGNRLTYELDRAWRKLFEAQLPDGAWSWFPGGKGNDYITLYITTGFGRLRHLGVDFNPDMAVRSLARLDRWMREHYEIVQKSSNPQDYTPTSTDALYLYGRSFFLKDRSIAPNNLAAINFFLQQARKRWLETGHRQSQAHLAIALKRWGGADNLNAARDIMKSLKEHSVTSEEMGMFWRDTEPSWWWYRAPIETQALMIEAFDEVTGDAAAVEDCRVWLLKQKQTQDWKTSKATADAIYALLLRGKDFLSDNALVEISLGGRNLTPNSQDAKTGERPQTAGVNAPVEPGAGFYEVRFAPAEIKPKLGRIMVKKTTTGVAWGAVHWQYLEDMAKIKTYAGTPLKLKKRLYTRVNTTKGPELKPVNGPLKVGDELVVRLELQVDRDMEFVHLKDQRGSGVEPVNVLSRHRYQDGLAYYETTRDTASHFFIEYLPKGAHVFEYATRIQHRGSYQTGMASIQCMYAPEFNSHSESYGLTVR